LRRGRTPDFGTAATEPQGGFDWQDWINYFLGLWVFGSPWFIEHAMIGTQPGAGSRGMLNLWVVGLAVLLLTTLAINGILNRAWAVPAVLALGAWLLLSPWLIGFSETAPLMWNSVICGALLFVFAGWGFAVERRNKSSGRGGTAAVR
jgi:hypothetical protein